MGAVISFFKKTPLAEQLEETEKAINSVRKNRYQSQQKQKRFVASVTLWSIAIYILCAITFLGFYFPPTWKLRALYSTPLLIAPAVVILLRRLVLWYFSGVIRGADEELRALLDRKKQLLEDVREKESYKKAKEILEKFDPEFIKQKNMAEELQRLRSQSANSQVRRRMPPGGQGPAAALPQQRPPIPSAPGTPHRSVQGNPGSPQFMPYRPVRPLPPQSRTAFDRMVEFMVGDGPNNRYALICSACLNHNGMALKEEHEYTGFRCAYCGKNNPAKKERPVAPKLPVSPAPSLTSLNKDPSSSQSSSMSSRPASEPAPSAPSHSPQPAKPSNDESLSVFDDSSTAEDSVEEAKDVEEESRSTDEDDDGQVAKDDDTVNEDVVITEEDEEEAMEIDPQERSSSPASEDSSLNLSSADPPAPTDQRDESSKLSNDSSKQHELPDVVQEAPPPTERVDQPSDS